MNDIIKLFEKLFESWKGSKTSLIVAAVLAVLLYKLVEHFLPKIFSSLFKNLRNYFKSGSAALKAELRLRKYIITSANINWVGSIKSLAKYHTNIGLLKVFHPVTFQKRNTSSPGNLELNNILFDSSSLVIVGKPGSGKSSLINFIANTFATDQALEKFHLKEVRIPIILTLRYLKKIDIFFPELLANYLRERGCEVNAKLIQKKLEKGKCIILMDGLDEITNPELRKAVVSWIADLISSYQGNRFIVTCRDIDWLDLKVPGLDEYYVSDLNLDQTKTIIDNWSQSFQGELKQHLKNLHVQIQTDNRLVNFCSTPLLLTIVIVLTANKISIPYKRAQIFRTFFNVLVKEWAEIKDTPFNPHLYDAASINRLLQSVALYLVENQKKDEIIDMQDLNFLAFLSGQLRDTSANVNANDLITLFQTLCSTGIIIQVSDSSYAFSNRGFLEYLASQEILRAETKHAVLDQFEHESWSEIILLVLESAEDSDLTQHFLGLNSKTSKASYFRTVSELLVRGLVPNEATDKIQTICVEHILSSSHYLIDQRLFNNLYRNDKDIIYRLFQDATKKEITNFKPIAFAFCNISDKPIIDEIERVFSGLTIDKQKFLISSLADNSFSEDFLWGCIQSDLYKDTATASLVAKGSSVYNNCLARLVNGSRAASSKSAEIKNKTLAFEVLHHFQKPELLSFLNKNQAKFSFELVQFIGTIAGGTYTPLLQKNIVNGWYKKYGKRPLETLFALTALVFLAPVILLIGIIVKIETKGPMIIAVSRIGLNKKMIRVYKFRTLWTDAANHVMQSTKNDTRVTTFGRFLRRSGLDEIPLLFCVVTGDLALVGPAMLPFAFLQAFPEVYDQLYTSFRPGLTGRARIKGYTSLILRTGTYGLEHDLTYTYRCTFWTDLKILVYTPLVVLFKDKRNAF
ncbi:MAG: sugar transferase [Chitinophagaceae bacterium]